MLEDQDLPRLPYNPVTDKVLARYAPSDGMEHRFYGFAPIADESPDGYTELTYEQSEIPLDRWQVKVNGDVVYEEPEEKEEEAANSELGSGEGDYSSALIEQNR
jgi:hypothetical protein